MIFPNSYYPESDHFFAILPDYVFLICRILCQFCVLICVCEWVFPPVTLQQFLSTMTSAVCRFIKCNANLSVINGYTMWHFFSFKGPEEVPPSIPAYYFLVEMPVSSFSQTSVMGKFYFCIILYVLHSH